MVEISDSESETPEVVSADPGRQRAVLLGVALFLALAVRGVHEIGAAFDTIRALTRTEPEMARRQILSVLDVFVYGMAALMAVMGLYLTVQGIRIVRAGRFPPLGARVVTDTRVLRGSSARRRAWMGWGLAGILWLGAALLPSWGRGELLRRIYLPVDLGLDEPRIVDPDTPDVPLYPMQRLQEDPLALVRPPVGEPPPEAPQPK